MALKDGTLLSSGTAPPNYSTAALTETKRAMEVSSFAPLFRAPSAHLSKDYFSSFSFELFQP